jgi:predicted DNA-binding WGR domain protein
MSKNAHVVFHFFGWFFDPEKNNDKIWGWAEVEGKLYNFWGRRGDAASMKRIKFKRHENKRWDSSYDLKDAAKGKEKKGYKAVDVRTLDSEGNYTEVERVYPGFTAHMRKELMYGRLTGTVRGEEV